MTAVLNVSIRGLPGEFDLTLPIGSSVADAREAAGLNDGLTLRADGSAVADEASTPVYDDQVLVATAPDAKHGIR